MRCTGLVAQQPCGIIVPWSGMEPVSPALQGGFLITGPPGKSWNCPFCLQNPTSFINHLLIKGIWGDTIFSIFKQQNFQQSWYIYSLASTHIVLIVWDFHLYLIAEHHLCECLCSFSHSSKPIRFKEDLFCYALLWKLCDYKDELDIQGIQTLKIVSNGAMRPGRYTKACS